jgi:pimeloyl-ACP methyl ester carboxylesterase
VTSGKFGSDTLKCWLMACAAGPVWATMSPLSSGKRSAHIFDDFAPTLAHSYHAYGITRRGYGASSVPSSGYTLDRLAEDILAAIDSLQIQRPIVVATRLPVRN